jgi:cytochrome c
MRWVNRTSVSLIAALAVGAALNTVNAAAVLSPAAQRGLVLVRANCAGCHAIDASSDSPLKIAPPMRTLHLKYPVESLRRPLSEGIIARHPTMPAYRFDPGQVRDIIAYLKIFDD